MKKNYFLKFALAFFIAIYSKDIKSQILTENFDDDSKFTKSETFFSDGFSDYFGILDPSDGSSNDFDGNSTNNTPSGLQTFTGNNGNYLRGEDLDGEGNSRTQVLTWSNLNIIGYTNLNFSVKLGASNGFDNNSNGQDEITLAVSIDGGGYTDISKFVVASGSSQFPTDGTTTLGLTMQTITGNISNTGSSINVRLTLRADSGNEEFAVDDLVIDGTASVAPTIAFDNATSSETETDATFTSANIPITVSNYSGSQIDINVDVTGRTAEAEDYTFTSPTTLSFTANETQNITVDINEDTVDFDNETIILTITETSSVSGLIISQSTHTLTISEDESAPTIAFDNATSSETETDATFTSANIPITVSNYSGSQIDINVDVTGGTAEAEDYTFTSPTTLSFTANETQNITVDINEDTDDFDNETIIFTITETSSVTGLIISQSTHALTIIEDESAPLPTAGSVIITEVLDSSVGFNNDYLELFNNSSMDVSLSTSKLIRLSSSGSFEYAYDFGVDESTASADLIIPAYGFIIIARGSSRSEFNAAYGITLDAGVSFNGGNTNLFFGSGRRWSLKTGGTPNSDDGTLIDDTLTGVGTSKDYRNIFTNTFISGSPSDGTPGELEYLLYTGDAWVNSNDMDETTGAQDVYIFDNYTITSDSDANNVGINTGTTLTVNSSSSFDINSDLTVNGNFNINSGGSLIVTGSSSGNIIYNRNIPTTNWYLVSSPVVGQDIDAFVATAGLASGTGSNVGLSDYNNATPGWEYYQNGASGTGNFTSGDGRSIKLASTGDISFTGTINTSDVNISITDATGSGGNAFNLVGNPYPSFIAANNNADGTNNILKVNDTDNDYLTESTIWFWNQGTSSYNQINHASTAKYIAPGQGFFVSADGAYNFSITEDMQSHQSTDSFQRSNNNRPEINLAITNGTNERNADIYYIEGTTTGWDNGYDSSIFGGVANEFAIYTHSVSNGNGRNLGIQSLPPNNFENMIIPLGINAEAGTAITIDAVTNNFPSGINIYLEDKQDNSFTLLEADANFSFTPENNLSGIGRFYLHTTSSVLSADDFATNNNISIYTSSKDNLRIIGVQNSTATVQLYNILGKEMLKTSFEGNGVNDINMNTIPMGIYIVKLATENGVINRKIIIQ